jgi:hypothetical protein
MKECQFDWDMWHWDYLEEHGYVPHTSEFETEEEAEECLDSDD